MWVINVEHDIIFLWPSKLLFCFNARDQSFGLEMFLPIAFLGTSVTNLCYRLNFNKIAIFQNFQNGYF